MVGAELSMLDRRKRVSLFEDLKIGANSFYFFLLQVTKVDIIATHREFVVVLSRIAASNRSASSPGIPYHVLVAPKCW